MMFAPIVVNFLGLKLNVLDHASLMNFGPNQWIDQFISYKRNQGFGEQNGDIVPIIIPISYVMDADIIDNSTVKNSII
ncbi:hypothetical protein NDK43_09945 [Neobacillus pocheonensis]|uniref:Uncharacterized protein n=1 Tax=Neobacillus pocheonensis TaxID=363869 RepID=A0ABT0W8L9_9BACI|nr:hypothetical protein [Neobacillus pocheonensis]